MFFIIILWITLNFCIIWNVTFAHDRTHLNLNFDNAFECVSKAWYLIILMGIFLKFKQGEEQHFFWVFFAASIIILTCLVVVQFMRFNYGPIF